MKAIGIPSKSLWGVLLRQDVPLYFHEDNQAMIQIVKTGKNPTMRHLGRVHRIAVAWLHERWLAGDVVLFYEQSELMAADIYTKGFSDQGKWKAVCWLINVVDPKKLIGMIQYNEELRVRLEAEAVEKELVRKAEAAEKAAAKKVAEPKPKPKAGSKGKGKGNSTGGLSAGGETPADSSQSVVPPFTLRLIRRKQFLAWRNWLKQFLG
jgi:hypothetical protein